MPALPWQIAIRTVLSLPAILLSAGAMNAPKTHWEIVGELTEACTCAVPCSCNFGQGPSPRHYCHSLFAVDIEKGHYGRVRLDGLHLAGAHGKKGDVWFIDAGATPEQAAALQAIAHHMQGPRRGKVYFDRAVITQIVGEKSNELKVGGWGGFEADYIMGMDRTHPVVVENNTSWNIPRSIKTKTKTLHYADPYGNKIDANGSNGNQGRFDWTDETKTYF